MTALGMGIYYFYPLKSTAVTILQHPYPEWTLQSYVMVGSFGGGLFFWLLNLIIGFNGNWFDYITLYIIRLSILAPLATIYFNFQTSASYGTDSDVALNSDWALSVDSDPYYSPFFNGVLFSSMIDLVVCGITWTPLGKQVSDKNAARKA
jgi:hypothetical protein